jgi:hypothetical protein
MYRSAVGYMYPTEQQHDDPATPPDAAPTDDPRRSER